MRKRANRCRNSGFTLIEIMIVILIISVLLTIAIPNWIKARETSRTTTCVSNMRQVDSAKEQYAMTANLASGAPCAFANIVPDYIKQEPACPNSGVYDPQPVGTPPTCTIPEHVLP